LGRFGPRLVGPITLNGSGDKLAMAVNGQKYQMLVGYRTSDVWSPQIEVSGSLRPRVRPQALFARLRYRNRVDLGEMRHRVAAVSQ